MGILCALSLAERRSSNLVPRSNRRSCGCCDRGGRSRHSLIRGVRNRNRLVCNGVHGHLLVGHSRDGHADDVGVHFRLGRRRRRRGLFEILDVNVLVDDVLLLLEVDVVELGVLDAASANEVLAVVLKIDRLLYDLVLVSERHKVHDSAREARRVDVFVHVARVALEFGAVSSRAEVGRLVRDHLERVSVVVSARLGLQRVRALLGRVLGVGCVLLGDHVGRLSVAPGGVTLVGVAGRALRVNVVLRGLLVGVVLYVVLLGLHVAVRLVLVGARVDRSLHCLVRCWVGMIPRCDVPGGIRAVFV